MPRSEKEINNNQIFIIFQGGLKAVIWTDTLQMLIMVIGFLSVIIKASFDSGGFASIWQKAYRGGRIEFWR